ncbi:hypothetical protein [Pedobacter sp. L105]|uniref:hypothetical protein n=1 Tax=Pedobacter sp. L105 TaxID=1641871 RepID=UPI00131CE761|nr:hypothetical protein [Pedobacter sp. L105]
MLDDTKIYGLKKLVLIVLLLGINTAFSQTLPFTKSLSYNSRTQNGKIFIFDQNETVTNSNAVGQEKGSAVIAYKGSRFTIEHIDSLNGDLTIKFLPFKLARQKNSPNTSKYTSASLKNRLTYNVKSNPENDSITSKSVGNNIRYFTLSSHKANTSVSAYADSITKWTVSLGTLTNPFKLRPTKGQFTSNLNLGTAIFAQYKFSENWAGGGILGISLTSITLDSASTTGHVLTTSERPAITPSVSFLIAYKNINFTLGVGIDYINTTTDIEKSWIFNKKPWIGFGIGISLFNGSVASISTVAIAGQ